MSSFFARVTMLVGIGLTLSMWPSSARTAATDPIGLVTTLEGKAYVAREGGAKPLLLNGQDEVLIHDVIETQSHSRLKILFYDDSLLTIAENSRIEIREFAHGSRTPSKLIIQLDRGAIRNSIGGQPSGAGPKFQVQTPAALIGARDAYFTVWIDEGIPALIQDGGEQTTLAQDHSSAGPLAPPAISHRQVGIANIGQAGSVTLTSGGHSIVVNPGQYVVAAPNTASVTPSTWTATPPLPVATVIAATDLKALPKIETPKETLRMVGGGTDITVVSGMSSMAPAAMAPPIGQIRVPQVMMTPPAVISGAAQVSP